MSGDTMTCGMPHVAKPPLVRTGLSDVSGLSPSRNLAMFEPLHLSSAPRGTRPPVCFFFKAASGGSRLRYDRRSELSCQS
jgi:hypothetical protein